MNKSLYRTGILVFGVITGLIHLVLLNILLGEFSPLFSLNGLGFLVLTGALLIENPLVLDRQRLLHYAFIGYTGITILAFIVLGDTGFGGGERDWLGWATKLDELLLIVALLGNLSTLER